MIKRHYKDHLIELWYDEDEIIHVRLDGRWEQIALSKYTIAETLKEIKRKIDGEIDGR